MTKIGLFFGSFNPIHVGHLIIANYMAHYTELDEVWLVVSPQNPLKAKKNLLNMYDRLEMVDLALKQQDRIKVCDIEFRLPKPSYTIDTLTYLKERYPNKNFALIMGSDNLSTLNRWKNYQVLLRDYRIFIYPRPNYKESDLASHPSITITDTPLIEISSTFIRKAIKEAKSIRYLVPDAVLEYIDKKGIYSN